MGVSRDDSTLSREENIVAFVDTMIFLHFQPFDQIDWPTVLNANQVTLTIPPIIMRELNKHKDTHALRKIRYSFESAKSFGIEYRINAGNVPHEDKGTLHVIIDRQ